MTTVPRRRARTAAVAAVFAAALVLGACGDAPEGVSADGAGLGDYQTELDRTLLYPHNVDYDPRDPDSVSLAFVRIVENHDASLDGDEWTSVLRAEALMTEEAAEGYSGSLDGGTETDWWQWRDVEAFTTANVAFSEDARPGDTDDEAFRIVTARITPRTDTDREMPQRMRIHHLQLHEVDGRWLVHRWLVSPTAPVPSDAAAQ